MDMIEQAPGVGDGQGNLAWYSPEGPKQSDMTEQLNWTDSMDMSLSKLREIVKDKDALSAALYGRLQRVRHDLATEQQ